MATIIASDLEVCIDCTQMIANGEGTEELAEAIALRWGNGLVLNCPEDCDGYFSWQSCDGCGSTLGGDRHPAVAFSA